jgi:hypothetical protein
VGLGSVVGRLQFMEYGKSNHPEIIRSVGLSTGWDAVGRWQISNVEGQYKSRECDGSLKIIF